MSEKIYALLFRLHSSRFRRMYGDEALQLFRDRARDERGFVAKLRLWFDLLRDLAVSVPRGYGGAQPHVVGFSASRELGRLPSFLLLAEESPGRGALLSGAVLSLVTLLAVPVSIGHFDKTHPVPERARAIDARKSVMSLLAAQAPVVPGDSRASLGAGEQRRIIQAVIRHLNQHYPDPAMARKITDALRAKERNGDYASATAGSAFADRLTKEMKEASQDAHLELVYSQAPLPHRLAESTPERVARYRQAMEQSNCTFEKVAILPGNIGYVKLNSFPDPSICQATVASAMASVNAANAIIFDLRDNRGGYPGMVMLLAAYLFDHPEYMYNPRENTTRQSWTQSPVPGNKLADKPVYLLTSGRTASAAEQFAFNLKMLKWATLVGETTRGSAHAGVFHRMDDHFGIAIRETKPINPYSHDWEDIGVKPNVEVREADALERAQELAKSRLGTRRSLKTSSR